MTDAFVLLKAGNFFGGFLQSFVEIGIAAELFYAIILGIAVFAVYARTKNIQLVALTLILMGSGITAYADQAVAKYFLIVVLGGVALAVYMAFKQE